VSQSPAIPEQNFSLDTFPANEPLFEYLSTSPTTESTKPLLGHSPASRPLLYCYRTSCRTLLSPLQTDFLDLPSFRTVPDIPSILQAPSFFMLSKSCNPLDSSPLKKGERLNRNGGIHCTTSHRLALLLVPLIS
jgi:hypothetical protein